MGESFISSNKTHGNTGTDPECSEEDNLKAVTANLVLNLGPEPINYSNRSNYSNLNMNRSDSNSRNRYYSNDRSQVFSNNRYQNFSNN